MSHNPLVHWTIKKMGKGEGKGGCNVCFPCQCVAGVCESIYNLLVMVFCCPCRCCCGCPEVRRSEPMKKRKRDERIPPKAED